MSSSQLRNVSLQQRDVSLLVNLLESRVLSLDHIRTLHFPGKTEMAKKRMQRLKAAGYISERPRRVGEPSVLHLTWKGYVELRGGGHIGDDVDLTPKTFARRMTVSKQTLAHELMVADLKASFTVALRKAERFSNISFEVWPRRYEFTVNRGYDSVLMKPDGLLRFHEVQGENEYESSFFIEADTGTESLDRVVEKCVNYREYHRTGGFALSCGGIREEYKEYPFRVLVVCRSEERRDNLAKKLAEADPPFSTMVLLTTLGKCAYDPLGEIWATMAAYKEILAGHGASIQYCSICE